MCTLLSDEPEHKLFAAMILRRAGDSGIRIPPDYLERCSEWHDALSESDKAVAAAAVTALNAGDRQNALQMVAALPRVPLFP
jgi:hypothetical protein